MASMRYARISAWLLALGLGALMFNAIPTAFAQLDGLSVTMDADHYNIADTGTICYTVPGPGQVTMTNNSAAGTITLLSVRDDGSGDCKVGPIQGPAGKYCVVVLFAGPAGVGTAQTCYQVIDAASEN